MEGSKEYEEVEFLSKKILDLNKQLIESEKSKSRFLSLVTHELNNPMTALLGLIPHLKPTIDDAHKKTFDFIHQEALNLNFSVQNLVAAAEIESGSIDTTFASVDIGDVLQEAIDDLYYLILDRNIVISVYNSIESTVVCDPKKLHLILKNLISNACQHGLRNGMVDISIANASSALVISVSNQGNGPKVEFKPLVFTRFAEGVGCEHGFGIGLSIVRELSEFLDGSIDYTVNEEWVTFTVTVPLLLSCDLNVCGSNEFLFESFEGAVEL